MEDLLLISIVKVLFLFFRISSTFINVHYSTIYFIYIFNKSYSLEQNIVQMSFFTAVKNSGQIYSC